MEIKRYIKFKGSEHYDEIEIAEEEYESVKDKLVTDYVTIGNLNEIDVKYTYEYRNWSDKIYNIVYDNGGQGESCLAKWEDGWVFNDPVYYVVEIMHCDDDVDVNDEDFEFDFDEYNELGVLIDEDEWK